MRQFRNGTLSPDGISLTWKVNKLLHEKWINYLARITPKSIIIKVVHYTNSGKYKQRMLNMVRNMHRQEGDVGLISNIYCMVRACCSTLFLLKWRSISICLLCAWKTRFAASWVALWLSHHTRGGDGREMQNLGSANRIQVTSATVAARAQYSDFALLRDMTFCLVEGQETRLDPKKNTIASCASSIIWAWCPIRISISLNIQRWRWI